MKLHVSPEWLMRRIAEDERLGIEEPSYIGPLYPDSKYGFGNGEVLSVPKASSAWPWRVFRRVKDMLGL